MPVPKAVVNREVFSSFLKVSMEVEEWDTEKQSGTDFGREFQTRGALRENARAAVAVLQKGAFSKMPLSLDLRERVG